MHAFRGLAVVLTVLVATGGMVRADLYQFTGSDADGSVNATVQFTLGNGTVHIVVTDLQQNPTSAGQLVSGIDFMIGGSSGVGSLTQSSGLLTTISPGGAYTNPGAAQTLSHWDLSSAGELTTLTGGRPDQLIIGPDNKGGFNYATGAYTNANSSITGNSGNPNGINPTVLGSATFDLAISGITAASAISGVQIEFGTQPELTADATLVTAVPEPSTLAIGGLGGLSLAAYCLFKRRRLAAPCN